MRVLLDTNIVIHREAAKITNRDIGVLFKWLDQLHYSKWIHPLTITELNRFALADTVMAMNIKLKNYHLLKTLAPLHAQVKQVSDQIDKNDNDLGDTKLLNEVYCDRVDILISEDRKIHRKAALLGIQDKVFRIDSFLEKVNAENPGLVDYNVLSVRQELFGNINLTDSFFDSFREDYKGFDKWFNQKAHDLAYICYNKNILSAFLFIKVEDDKENYSNITPVFSRKRRLKIGTFKVTSNGIKLGERFLKIIFDNARQYKVQEIYVTIFDKRPEQERLIALLEEWGFVYYGIKITDSGEELVYVRDFSHLFNKLNPKLTFPYLSNKGPVKENKVYILPIRGEYHTELFPDSKLNTEPTENFIDNAPHRNAISKAYITHSREKNLQSGDLIVFYRIGDRKPKIYTSVATTVGIIENVHYNIKSLDELIELSRKRTVLTTDELRDDYWSKYLNYKPFVVNFLYAYSFKKRATLEKLLELGVIPDINDMPRSFREITWNSFSELVKFAKL